MTLFQSGPGEVVYARQVSCLDHRGALARQLTFLGRIGGWRWGFGSTTSLQQVFFARRLITELRQGKYDIVHMQDAWASRLLERARRNGRHPAKVILGHGTEEEFEFLLEFDHVQELAPCYLERDRQIGLPPERRWFAIPNFIDCQQFCSGDRSVARAKFGISADAFVVLDVAALKRTHKRLDWLAQEMAHARCKQSNILLVVAGAQTSETTELVRFLKDALPGHVKVLTNVQRQDMPDLYRTANVFAHAALTEMMPISLLEAMASGLPVIANRAPIFEWIVGEGGVLVDMQNPGDLATAAGRFVADSTLAHIASRKARLRVLEQFETARVVDQISAMYQSVLSPK